MLALLEAINPWHWVILALLLLAGEALGAAGFMIGISLSALIVAGLMAMDLVTGWPYQFLWFALFSVIMSILFWRFFRRQSEHDVAGVINDRAAQLVGRKLTLAQSLENGSGKIQIGDTLWKVCADDELAAGTKVEVYASDGMTLLIRAVDAR